MLNTKKIANLISTIGNPMVLSVVVAIIVNFREFPLEEAIKLTAILLICGILPIYYYVHRQVKAGKLADHDVSDRNKRKAVYPVALAFLLIMILVLYFTKQPQYVTTGAIAAWVLAFCSFLINFKLKASLHTSFAFLIAMMSFKTNHRLAYCLLIVAFLIAWSRLELRRHTLTEIFLGASLGFVIGSIYQYYNVAF